ncbi:MAG: hypothetical protein ABEJ71_00730 [Halodesulfurarchaeum sp.]
MTTLRERVPRGLRTPLSISTVIVGIAGIGVGYILTLTGIVMYFNLHSVAKYLSATESITVTVVGLVVFGIGVTGWRGYMYFAY